jgi:hypothetical protein
VQSLYQVFPLVLCAALAAAFVAMRVVGPTRWVKRLFAFLVVVFVVDISLRSGVRVAVGYVAATFALNFWLSHARFRSLRFQRSLAIEHAPADALPAFARSKVDEETRAFERLGYVAVAEVASHAKVGDEVRDGWSRILRHHSGTSWGEIGVSAKPRVISRMVKSVVAGGGATRLVATSDTATNMEVLPDASWTCNRVAGDADVERLVANHTAFCASNALALVAVDDVVEASVRTRNAWAEGVVASGVCEVDGEWIVIAPSKRTRIIFRTWARLLA